MDPSHLRLAEIVLRGSRALRVRARRRVRRPSARHSSAAERRRRPVHRSGTPRRLRSSGEVGYTIGFRQAFATGWWIRNPGVGCRRRGGRRGPAVQG